MEKDYTVIMEVAGSCRLRISATSEDEAKKQANYICQEGDFGLLEEIEWQIKSCQPE